MLNSCPPQVYKACTDWVSWDLESRSQYLHALLNAVHIYALPPKFLKNQLLSCPILSKVVFEMNESLLFFCFPHSVSFIHQWWTVRCVSFVVFLFTSRPIPVRTSCQKSFRRWRWWSFLLHQTVGVNSSMWLAGMHLFSTFILTCCVDGRKQSGNHR